MEWKTSPGAVPYEDAVAFMEARVRDIRLAKAGEMVWLLEHPPLYTAGSSANETDLIDTLGFPVFKTGRGGQYTYHGPGQRVAYVMLDLKKRGADVRQFIKQLENWIIATLAEFDVESFTREGRIGVWVATEEGERKIGAIGVRIRQWVSYHGISLNVNPDLSHYRGIIPCGIKEYGVTSLAALDINAHIKDVDEALKENFRKIA